MRVLAVNPGSSSLKLSVIDPDGGAVAEQQHDGAQVDAQALAGLLEQTAPVGAAGVRVVHGGLEFRQATRVDADVLRRLDALSDLAPLHNPPAIAALAALGRLAPGLPLVACFDTAFHRTIPDAAALYALPSQWQSRWQPRRFGFHGLSHAWASARVATLLGRDPTALRVVSCHLGAGASLCAVRHGRSVDTTMGFTPMEGLVMATRSGSVDPGLVLWLQRRGGLSAEQVEHGLDREAGLLGLSGTSAGMREVVSAAEAGDARAGLALDVYVHRLVRSVGAMTASAGGIDALVFTGGVGENAALVRRRCCTALGHLGVVLDDDRNGVIGGEGVVSAAGSAVAVAVVTAREDLQIAAEVRAVLRPDPEDVDRRPDGG